MAQWPDPERRSVIRLDRMQSAPSTRKSVDTKPVPAVETATNGAVVQGQRSIKTMLFADVMGYSKLDEARIPAFLFDFWSTVASRLNPKPPFVNTWGDAIFAVMNSVCQCWSSHYLCRLP